jgi:hypothetical protein
VKLEITHIVVGSRGFWGAGLKRVHKARIFRFANRSISEEVFVVIMALSAQVAPKTKSSAKKPRAKPVRPRTSEMVGNAIKNLKEGGGSSLRAIKKYAAANYEVDSEKISPSVKKYLKAAVATGEVVQTKGNGAPGSFKLAAAKAKKTAASTAPARGRRGASSAPKEKKQNPSKATKAKSPKKAAVKAAEEKKRASPAKAKKSPTTAKKLDKVPTKKPKTPRPKTAAKAKTPKKTSPKKK